MTGSHLHSQPSGGRFDGTYSVLAGLEALEDAGVVTGIQGSRWFEVEVLGARAHWCTLSPREGVAPPLGDMP